MGTLTACTFSSVSFTLAAGPATRPRFSWRRNPSSRPSCFLCRRGGGGGAFGLRPEVRIRLGVPVRCLGGDNEHDSEKGKSDNERDSSVSTAEPPDLAAVEELESGKPEPSLSSEEIGHFLAAFPKKVKLSIPFFIPNITLGSFGAITQFKSILPDRSTKVDISLAGPFAGAALSFSMFAVGLLLTANPDSAPDLIQIPSNVFQGSLLLGLISRAYLGYAALHAATVSIHPLVIAGWCGLTTTAFNMLPVGCLDGGRAVQGAFGKLALNGFGLTTYAMLGLGVLGGPLSLPWGLYVLICQRAPEKPCLNDVTEVGTWRKAAVATAILLVALTLLPVWDELAEELGIGLISTF